jgi:outer membrane receptor protein involved in Fe transport
MKKLWVVALLLSCSLLNAQRPQNAPNTEGPPSAFQSGNMPKGTAKIKGMIQDSALTKGVEFANIALFDKAQNKLVDGAVADEKGRFMLENIAAGSYKIEVTFLGFDSKTIDNISLKDGQTLDLKAIKVVSSDKLLNEVTVTSQKSMIEEKVDRLVYNAEKDQTARGGDATDVLRKVPMLTVDLDGNVSLRGTSNIRVLINNKPSTIMASNVADALKQIPADMIKSVEVITSPSAKYDAEGSGGIINIITKKNTIEGYSLNLDLGVGNRASMLGLNGNYRKGKFGASIGGHGRYMYNKATTDLEQSTIRNNATFLTKQFSDAYDQPLHGRYNVGFDYDLAKNQSLTGGIRFGVRNFAREQNQTTSIFEDNNLLSTTNRFIDSRDLSNSIDVNVDYLHTFKPQQEWSVSTQYSTSDLTNNFESNNLDPLGAVLNRLKNINVNKNQELTFQSDYQTPLSTNQLLEFGGKAIFRKVNSVYQYQAASSATNDYTSDATRPAGQLDYTQNVAAAYASYTFTTKSKYSFKAGTRYEYTDIKANQIGKSEILIPAYGTLVPSLNISKTLSEGTTLKLGYNRRIQRPGLQQLNPNFNASNSQNISVGNPSLSPELTNNVELGFSTRIKQTFVNISLFTRLTDNAISQVRRTSEQFQGALISTFENVGKQGAYGANIFANVYLLPNWTLNGGGDVYYNVLEGQITDITGQSVTAKNTGVAIGGRIMSNLTLKKGWGVQGFAFMHGPRVQLQGQQGGFAMYSVGVKKDFSNKKGSIGIAGENFLSNSVGAMRTEFTSPQFSQLSTTNLFNRGVRLTFTYKFGKMEFNEGKKTRSVKNDDIKDGEGGGGDGGGQGGGQPQGRSQQGQKPPMGGGGPPQKGAPSQSPKDLNKQQKEQPKEPKSSKEAPPKKDGN